MKLLPIFTIISTLITIVPVHAETIRQNFRQVETGCEFRVDIDVYETIPCIIESYKFKIDQIEMLVNNIYFPSAVIDGVDNVIKVTIARQENEYSSAILIDLNGNGSHERIGLVPVYVPLYGKTVTCIPFDGMRICPHDSLF